MSRTPESYLPLKELETQVLLALSADAQHGYALFTRVAELSQGFIVPGPTSLYRTLARLSADGLIENVEAGADVERDDARRRYYGLTRLGRLVLQAELRRLASLLREAGRLNLRVEEGGA